MTGHRFQLSLAIGVMVAVGLPGASVAASAVAAPPITDPAVVSDTTSDQLSNEPVVTIGPSTEAASAETASAEPAPEPVSPAAEPATADRVATEPTPDTTPAAATPPAARTSNVTSTATPAVVASTMAALTAPDTPSSTKAVPGNGKVTLSWLAPSPGTSPVTGYTITYAQSGGTWNNLDVAANALSHAITGLSNGTTYWFRVSAFSVDGRSPWTTSVSSVPRTVPSVPRSLTATPGYNQMTLRWAAPASTGGSPIVGYAVAYAPSGGTWTTVNVSAASRSRTFTPLRGGTVYYFRVAVYNAAGRSAPTTSVKAVPIANRRPGAASIYAVTAGNHAVGLRWSQPVDTGGRPITQYVVQIGSAGVWRNLAFVSGATRSSTATGLVNGRTYYFRVRAANSLGWSPSFSNTVRAVPIGPPPPPPPPPSGTCDPNYSPCVPIASDVDCAGGSGNGPAYVNGPVFVIGADIYGLDGNHDGVGCE